MWAVAEIQSDRFETIARDWLKKRANHWSAETAAMVRKRLERYVFPRIGPHRISKVTSKELLAVMRVIEKAGALGTARRVAQYCSRIFMYAIVTDRAESN